MIGAVVRFELLQAGRRRRGFYLRWVYAAFLLAQIAPIFFLSRFAWRRLFTGFDVYDFFQRFLVEHFVFLGLLTPAVVGGAITEEKLRGTLQYLLTTHIRAGEILLGKVLSSLYQLGLLAMVGLPLFCFFAALSGDWLFPVLVFVATLAMVFGIACLSILASVLCRTTRDALLCLYLALLGVVVVPPLLGTSLGPALERFDPLQVLALDHTARWQGFGNFLLSWLAVGLAALVLGAWRLRRTYRRQLQSVRRTRPGWLTLKRRKMRGNPVQWREQHVEGLAPTEFLRWWPRWLAMAAVFVLSAGTLAYALAHAVPPAINIWALVENEQWHDLRLALAVNAVDVFYWHGLGLLMFLTFIVAVRASGAITTEKEKGTWLALVLTPLTTRRILQGKQWGIFWACVPYVLAHAAVAVPVAIALGFESVTWALLWIGLTLLAVFLGAAVGLWSSAGAGSSWRSLLTTLVLMYCGWLAFMVPVTLILLVFRGALDILIRIVGFFANVTVPLGVLDSLGILPWALCLGIATAFWVLNHRLMAAAVERVGRNDREGGIDYFYLVRNYHRKLAEEPWTAPRLENLYEEEPAAAVKEKDEAAIPLNS